MRIAHCQFETWCGEFDHNLQRVEDGLARADKERAEIVSSLSVSSPATPTLKRSRAKAPSPPIRRK